MAKPGAERRLAAIVAIDAVGYLRHLETGDEGAGDFTFILKGGG